MTPQPTVFLVDDDQAVADSLGFLLRSVGLPSRHFGTAQEFLDVYVPSLSGCLVLDVRLPGLSGLELHERLLQRGSLLPVIIVSSHADVKVAVRAMKARVLDFLEKPFDDQALLDGIHRAFGREAEARRSGQQAALLMTRSTRLTPREREVLALMAAGNGDKAIAGQLDISRKTLSIHRGRVFAKMEAESLAHLLRMVCQLPVLCPPPDRSRALNARPSDAFLQPSSAHPMVKTAHPG